MRKALLLFAHPSSKQSRANRRVFEELQGVQGLTCRSLYDLYPEFNIAVDREKALLLEHDALILQHPFYWYSMPPLLKLWIDLVLEYNFAYGPEGKALVGKDFLLSITTGGSHESYHESGHNRFPIQAFYPPYRQTAQLCGMNWHEPLVLHHSSRASKEVLSEHARTVRLRIEALIAGGKS